MVVPVLPILVLGVYRGRGRVGKSNVVVVGVPMSPTLCQLGTQ